MATTKSKPAKPFIRQLATYLGTTAGLDLSLRMVHALAIIASQVLLHVETVQRCAMVATQLTLARRYLRFFSFIGCFDRVYQLLSGDLRTTGTLSGTLDLVEQSCLGLYFALEDLTMLHDMNVWQVPWYRTVLVEANKFWFYAVSAIVLRTLRDLYFASSQTDEDPKEEKEEKEKKPSSKAKKPAPVQESTPRTAMLRRLIASSCDLTLPGAFVGWVPLESLGIGTAMAVSTVLAWPEVWASTQH